MRLLTGSAVMLACISAVSAADIDAGKAKAVAVCAACHGANGISVSDTIPNLAGQKPAYLQAQLKALKAGARTHQIMNAIASQLTEADIANVAVYFSAQPGSSTVAKSELLPNLAKTSVAFPENYRSAFTRYTAINFPATRQVRYYYANDVAMQAAKAGKSLPDGSMLFVEVFTAKLDAEKKPLIGADGLFLADRLAFYTAMARDAGWGKDIPDMLRNEDWNYTIFTADRKHRAGVNQAECLACHKPLDKTSFTFTLKQLAEGAKAK